LSAAAITWCAWFFRPSRSAKPMLTVTDTSFRGAGRGRGVAGFFRGRPGPRSANRVASIVFRSASM
jgi:hypothetical protein